MWRMEKPNLTEFMLRGIDLADALDILDQWETLTDAEREALGFSASRRAPRVSAAPRSLN